MSSEWTVTTIGEICNKVFSGGTPTSTNAAYYEGGTVPWLRTKEVNYCKIYDTEQRITQLGFENSSTKLVPANSVIVAMYGNGDTAGRVAINKVPITTNQACCNLVVDASKADYRFVYYYLMGQYRALVDLKNGGAQQNLNGQLIKAFPITLPSVEEQRELSGLLEALDDRITLLRETNATLEAIAQALFKSWFVDFDPVRAKMEGRAPEGMDEATAALFPDALEESELGWVPRGWRVGAVEDFAERVGMGPFGSNIKVETFVPSGVPVISGQHLKRLLVEDNTFNFITPEHANRLVKSSVQTGDVIFTHAGSIGQVSLLHKDAAFPSYVLSQRQFFLRCNSALMSPEWIAHYFKSPVGQHQLLANTSQVGVPSIARPVSYLRSIRLVTPPPELSRKFGGVSGAMNDCVMANRSQLTTLSTLRDTLLPRLISGQLRLPEAQAATEAALVGALQE